MVVNAIFILAKRPVSASDLQLLLKYYTFKCLMKIPTTGASSLGNSETTGAGSSAGFVWFWVGAGWLTGWVDAGGACLLTLGASEKSLGLVLVFGFLEFS